MEGINSILGKIVEIESSLYNFYEKRGRAKEIMSEFQEKKYVTTLDGKVMDFNEAADIAMREGHISKSQVLDIVKGLKGGVTDNKSLQDIAKKHSTSLDKIKEQLKLGIRVEQEHTSSASEAIEIAKDHLWEIADYYTRLEEMEEEAKGEIEKGRAGIYVDTPENRSLKRVGQKYGTGKQEEQPGNKKPAGKEDTSVTQTPEGLAEFAKNSSEKQLQEAIKSSPEEKVRQAAHNELERRQKEEHPQKEEAGKEKQGEEKKEEKPDLTTKEGFQKEIKRLRDIDTDDIDEIGKIADQIQELRKQYIEMQGKESGLREVGFEEYRKGFKRFKRDTPSGRIEAIDYYSESSNPSKKYLAENKEIDKSILEYTNDAFEEVRQVNSGNKLKDFVFSKEEINEISDNLSKFISDNKIKENLSLNRRVSLVGEQNKTAKDFFSKLKKGDVYEDASFSSTSILEMSHFGDFNIEILAKKGSSVAPIDNKSELEYLIDKGSKFRVLDTTETGMVVELL